AHQLFTQRFANASDFHFYFVGNIDETVFEEYVTQYIASLPDNAKKERPVDLGYRMKQGDIKKVIHKGQDPKSTVSIMYYGDTNYDAKEARVMRALGEILSIKLIEEVRENESGVYGISARGSISKYPYGSYSFNIGFPCSPDNAENLINSCIREVNKIVENGPEAKDLDKFLEAEKVKFKENLKENRYWMGNFTGSFSMDRDPEEILNTIKNLEEITLKDIQNVAKKYLTGDKTVAILMPEEAK
ncbi:MAG: M16 family metallopeptidase, partial [Flavobacterium sp.]